MSTAMPGNADLGTCIRFHSFFLGWQQQKPDNKMNLQLHHFMVYESILQNLSQKGKGIAKISTSAFSTSQCDLFDW